MSISNKVLDCILDSKHSALKLLNLLLLRDVLSNAES